MSSTGCYFVLPSHEWESSVTNIAEKVKNLPQNLQGSNLIRLPRQNAPSKQTDEIDENYKNHDPRDYQQEFIRKARSDNIIVYLPTGTGKTLIAVQHIKNHLFPETPHPTPPPNHPLWVLFLTPSVPLAIQQGKVIRSSLQKEIKVLSLYGDFEGTGWEKRIKDARVLVMTHGVLDTLLSKYQV
jgi:ERCC4-related helicase